MRPKKSWSLLKSQFCAHVRWPPENANFQGKIALVSGSNSRPGLESSRQLLLFGLSSLIIALRSVEKGEQVALKFRSQFPAVAIQVWPLDMDSSRAMKPEG
ncbi:hypothetical protein F5B19DRAFT_118719 [Rostrohypoxylon terebratum]|nr:hypothetical protein F5B19DRAFT_118719 [Rostrohypoxylon terebratum]